MCRWSVYGSVLADLAYAGIYQHILVAYDDRDFNIVPVAEHAMGAIRAALDAGLGVLVHCWGGVNRSAAVAALYLTTQCGVPLTAAVRQLTQQRGTVLTNQAFCKQLVQHCFKHGHALEGSAPPYLLSSPSRQHRDY